MSGLRQASVSKRLYVRVALGLCSLVSCYTWADSQAMPTDDLSAPRFEARPEQRPKIALVLAGGGAKGAAHIGVLKALEELNIPVDYITGTSMGAYVAGLYATGMSADDIEALVTSIDWSNGYRDRVNRSERRLREKEYEDRYQLNTDLGIGLGEIHSPVGVVLGQSMWQILRKSTGNLPLFRSFDDLAIPYRPVATDIVNLEPVVISRGYLSDAMMASMSVPGVLPPFPMDGKMLVDGGVTNNMPVDVARKMGADIVIAVDISTDYKSKDAFTDMFTVADQLSNYLVRRNTDQQAQQLKGDDVYIKPHVGDMETTEFDRMPEAYEQGYRAVFSHLKDIKKLSVTTAEYQAYQDKKEAVREGFVYGHQVNIEHIVINNHTHYSDEWILKRLDLPTGEALSQDQVEKSVKKLYALDRFQLISYHYRQGEDGNEIVFDIKEKSWGPNYANFRFFLEDDFRTSSQYGLGLSTNFTDLNDSGAEFRFNFDVGTDKLAEGELFTPIYSSPYFYNASKINYSEDSRNFPQSDIENPDISDVYDYWPVDYDTLSVQSILGWQPQLWQDVRIGLRYSKGDATLSNNESAGTANFERRGIFADYRLDSLDNYALPNEGWLLNVEYLMSYDDVNAGGLSSILPEYQDNNDRVYELNSKLLHARTFGRHTLVAQFNYSYVKSEADQFPINPAELGGFLNLSGIPRNSLFGKNKLYSSLVYRYRWFDNDFGLFKAPVYLGGSIERGGVWSDSGVGIDDAPMYNAGSVFAGIDSPIGPIVLAYGRTEKNMSSVYFIIGTSY